MSASKVPDLVKIGSMNTEMDMHVDTSILEPIICNQNFCRFVLDKKGFLHSYSKIQLGVKAEASSAAATGAVEVYLPIYTGVYALLDKVVLRAGAKVLSVTESFNHLMGYKSRFVTNENNKQREQMLTGRAGAYSVGTDELGNVGGDADEFGHFIKLDVAAPSYIPLGLDVAVANTRDGFAEKHQHLPDYMISTPDQLPTYQVALAELFPCLRHQQLPLYCFDEQISIELHFAKPGEVCCIAKNAIDAYPIDNTVPTTQTAVNTTIDTTSIKLIADYMFYDQQIMDSYKNKARTDGLTIVFNEHQLVKSSLTVANAQNYTRNLGGASKQVDSIIIAQYKTTGDGLDQTQCLLNRFVSVAPTDTTPDKLNIKFNDRNLFPQSRELPTVHRNDVQTVAKRPMFVTEAEYVEGIGELFTSNKLMGYNTTTLTGLAHYYAVDLQLGAGRINSRGLFLEMQSTLRAPLTQLVWLNIRKTIKLNQGVLDCYYN